MTRPGGAARRRGCAFRSRRTDVRLSVGPRRLPGVNERLVVQGAREHNLRNVDLDLPRDKLIVFTGLSGSGQVVAGVRHDLRGGPAALRRVAVRVRAPVPRADGQARRRLHRGAVARGVDRPEVDQPQPAVDRRHDHRGLRLPAPAVRARGHAVLPGLRRARHRADAAADRRPAARAARGHALPGARAGRPRPQGRVRRPVQGAAEQGLRARPGRRRGRPAHRAARRSRRSSSTTSRWSSTAWSPARASSAGSPTPSRPRSAWPAACSSSSWSTPTSTTSSRERRFSEHRACPNDHVLTLDEIEPRTFSFNAPVRRVPRVHRHRLAARGGPGPGGPRRGPVARRRRGRAVVADLQRVLRAACSARWPRTWASRRPCRGGRSRSGPRTRCCTARTTR